MKKYQNKNRGFITRVVVIVLALVLLKYIYDFDLIDKLTSGKFRVVLDTAYEWCEKLWTKYKDIIVVTWKYLIGLIK